MVLTKVSGDWISMISEMGATSSLAATLGSMFYQTEGREDTRSDQRHNIPAIETTDSSLLMAAVLFQRKKLMH
jgi:hypothetical protein